MKNKYRSRTRRSLHERCSLSYMSEPLHERCSLSYMSEPLHERCSLSYMSEPLHERCSLSYMSEPLHERCSLSYVRTVLLTFRKLHRFTRGYLVLNVYKTILTLTLFYWSSCTKLIKWEVMYMWVRNIKFTSISTIFWLDFDFDCSDGVVIFVFFRFIYKYSSFSTDPRLTILQDRKVIVIILIASISVIFVLILMLGFWCLYRKCPDRCFFILTHCSCLSRCLYTGNEYTLKIYI